MMTSHGALGMTGAAVIDATMTERPTDGDLLISVDERWPSRYTLARVPGPPQMLWPSCETAEREAFDAARNLEVDVWVHDGNRFIRLATYRRPPGTVQDVGKSRMRLTPRHPTLTEQPVRLNGTRHQWRSQDSRSA
jgi:hypothetical protein